MLNKLVQGSHKAIYKFTLVTIEPSTYLLSGGALCISELTLKMLLRLNVAVTGFWSCAEHNAFLI